MATKDSFLNDNSLLYFMEKLKGIFQQQQTGKGLSANDFTDAYKKNVDDNTSARHTHGNKTVLDGIDATKVAQWDAAQPNVLTGIKVNGVAQDIVDKVVNLVIATKLSELINDAGFVTKDTDITGNAATATKAQQDGNGNNIAATYAKLESPSFVGTPRVPTPAAGDSSTIVANTSFVVTAISNALAGITGIDFQIVDTLPSVGEKGVIYLVPNSGTGNNSYDEYIWVNNSFEKIGTTDVDLSNYWNMDNLTAITNERIDQICTLS